MKRVVAEKFGGPDVLRVENVPTPEPGPGQVRVALTSIGMNHADLMARRGEYKLSSGEPPFIPGIEGGGLIDAVGEGVTQVPIGRRVILGAEVARLKSGESTMQGTYRSHFILPAHQVTTAPEAIPDDQLGAIWLPYLTAWGCLIWKQNLQPGQFVALPAASSSVALAAAQIVRHAGAIPVGLTTSADKIDAIRALPTNAFEHIICTRDSSGNATRWHKELQKITGKGVDVFFDPVGAGDYLATEIRALAQYGVIWIYGLLGKPGPVDLSPLIRKHAAVKGWVLGELSHDPFALERGYTEVLNGFASGIYRQHIARTFLLAEVREAHQYMETGQHIGKLVLLP